MLWMIVLYVYLGIMFSTVLIVHLLGRANSKVYVPVLYKSAEDRNMWIIFYFICFPAGIKILITYVIPRHYNNKCIIRNNAKHLRTWCDREGLDYREEYKKLNLKGRYNMFNLPPELDKWMRGK